MANNMVNFIFIIVPPDNLVCLINNEQISYQSERIIINQLKIVEGYKHLHVKIKKNQQHYPLSKKYFKHMSFLPPL